MVLNLKYAERDTMKMYLLTLYCHFTQFSSFPLLSDPYISSNDIAHIYEY